MQVQQVETSQPRQPLVAKAPVRNKLTLKKMRELPEMNAHEHIIVKAPPHWSMQMLCNDKGTSTDWFNVTIRVVCGLELAKMHYATQTIKDFKYAVDIMAQMTERFKDEDVWKFRNNLDMDFVSAALRATDDLQDAESRESMIYAFRKARALMEPYVRDSKKGK